MKCFLIGFLILATIHTNAQKVHNITGSNIIQRDAQAALEFHNKVRKEVGAAPLEWSNELSAYAQEWAEHLAKTCKIEHRPTSGKWARKYGENLYWGTGKEFNLLEASEAWYSEINQYKYSTISASNWIITGHYTQMIWSHTRKIGMAKVKCRNGSTIIVANYDPPGNYVGEKPY